MRSGVMWMCVLMKKTEAAVSARNGRNRVHPFRGGMLPGDSREREIMPVRVILLLTAFLFGGFYDFAGCILTAVLGGFLLYLAHRRKGLVLRWSGGVLLSVVVLAGHILSVTVAVDRGMALAGVFRVLPLVLFALVLVQFEEDERREILSAVPWTGVLITAVSVLLSPVPAVREHLFLAGRLGGTFQYSNTMALYFLAGILIIQGRTKISRKISRETGVGMAVSAVLLLGILLTGSRSVFLFTAAVLLAGAWKNRTFRLFNLAALAAAVAAGAVYVSATGDYQNLGRFLTISASTSTLLGRLLYWRDALPLIAGHPLGLGYMGYYYSQGEIQTGVYSTVFVHNDLLQLILDAGWIPGAVFPAVLFRSLFSGSQDRTAKAVMAVTALHSLFDFDMQFLSIDFLFLTAMECAQGGSRGEKNGEEKGNPKLKAAADKKAGKSYVAAGRSADGNRTVWAAVCAGTAAVMIVSMYFLIPFSASYLGYQDLAVKLYPYYTEANTAILRDAATREAGEAAADRILQTNDSVALAYDAKALSSAMDGDYGQMIEWKELAIEKNPYALYEYVDYVSLLSRAAETCRQEGDTEGMAYYAERVREIPGRLRELETRTSPLGWKIRDLPETELPEDVTAYIESLPEI